MSYSNGFVAVYTFPDFTFDTGLEVFIKGPPGLEGRLVSVATVITTATTSTVTLIEVGSQTDPNAYGTHTVPVGIAEVSQNVLVRGVDERIPADGLVTVVGNGGAAAGDGDIHVMIEWS